MTAYPDTARPLSAEDLAALTPTAHPSVDTLLEGKSTTLVLPPGVPGENSPGPYVIEHRGGERTLALPTAGDGAKPLPMFAL